MRDSRLVYQIWNPTGNITALVETPVEAGRQPAVGEALMKRHPEVEQVGFVEFLESEEKWSEAGKCVPVHGKLRMAGGEFCGNASMCAAAMLLSRKNTRNGTHASNEINKSDAPVEKDESYTADATKRSTDDESVIRLQVSGAAQPVEIRVTPQIEGRFRTGIHMPAPSDVEKKDFICGHMRGTLPVVYMEGITHILIDSDSAFFPLLQDCEKAEAVIKDWCRQLKADGLGLMFLERDMGYGGKTFSAASFEPAEERSQLQPDKPLSQTECFVLRPLVYIPASGTLFWENSCASGSCAAGFFLTRQAGEPINLILKEPGGELNVRSCSESVWLYGTCCFIGESGEKISK